MTPAYVIATDVAWVDSVDGGRNDPIVWIARLSDSSLFALERTAWLVWSLLAEGYSTADAIRAEITTLQMTTDFGADGLDGFLAQLADQRLIVAQSAPTPSQP